MNQVRGGFVSGGGANDRQPRSAVWLWDTLVEGAPVEADARIAIRSTTQRLDCWPFAAMPQRLPALLHARAAMPLAAGIETSIADADAMPWAGANSIGTINRRVNRSRIMSGV